MKRTCKQCGAEITLSEDEIAFYRSKNLHLPKRCENCRRENRAKAGGDAARQVVRPYREKRDGTVKWYVAAALLFVLLAVGIGVFCEEVLREDASSDTVYDADAEIIEESAAADMQSVLPTDLQAEISGGTDEVPMDMAEDRQVEGSEESENAAAGAIEDTQSEVSEKADDVPTDTPEDTQTSKTAPSEYTYSFRKAEYLQEHFEKHGAEFGYASADEYLAGANRVIASPDALHKLEAEDGDDVYYLESGNEFVIVSTDGYIRTYFKPNDGKAYFDRQ